MECGLGPRDQEHICIGGVVDSQDFCLSYLNRSIPFFPREKVEVKPKEQKLIVVEAPFCRGNITNGHYKIISVMYDSAGYK